jgi:hypothetical protein
LPDCEFRALDLTTDAWPEARRFDLVVCSEVLEHIDDWTDALASVVAMTRKYILITVPGGPVRGMDRKVGHFRHYEGPELAGALEALGCRVLGQTSWGWPFHSAYKAAISAFAPERLYGAFSGGRRYGLGKKAISELLYRLFFVNDLSGWGHQRIVLAHAPDARPSYGCTSTSRAIDLVGSWNWGEAR